MRTRANNGHPVFADLYDGLGGAAERGWMGRRRSRLLAGASGSVLEIGGGTGANLPTTGTPGAWWWQDRVRA